MNKKNDNVIHVKERKGEKNMQWCPITKSDCLVECAWFANGQCAFAGLHDISDSLDEIQERLIELDDTINHKNFSE